MKRKQFLVLLFGLFMLIGAAPLFSATSGSPVKFALMEVPERNIFGSLGFEMGGGVILGGFAFNPYYTLDIYDLGPFGLSLHHRFFDIMGIIGPGGSSFADFSVGPEQKFYSYHRAALEWEFWERGIEKPSKIGVSSDYYHTYYFEAPREWRSDLAVRLGYVGRLGGVGFTPILAPYPENPFSQGGDTMGLSVSGNTYYHGVSVGLAYKIRSDLDLMYTAAGVNAGEIHQYRYYKHSFDFFYYPYAELDTGGGYTVIKAPYGGEYNFNLMVGGGRGVALGVEMAAGAGPFVEAADDNEFDTSIGGELLNNLYFTFGVSFGYAKTLFQEAGHEE